MNVNKIPVNNAVNLSMFMVSVSAKLTDTLRCPNTEFSVLDLKDATGGRSIYSYFLQKWYLHFRVHIMLRVRGAMNCATTNNPLLQDISTEQ